MAWEHLKAATESTLYDGQGSFKSIMYRICSLVRKHGQQHAGWCTASEAYIAQTTGFSERQVQRAVAQFKKDGVLTVRTYRKGGKEFNHYRPNSILFKLRKRNLEEPELISETIPDDAEAGEDEGTGQDGVWPDDTVSQSTRQDGGGVCIATEVKEEDVNAFKNICRAELRSTGKTNLAISSKALTGKDHGGAAPKPPLCSVSDSVENVFLRSDSESTSRSPSPLESAADAARSKVEKLAAVVAKREPIPPPPSLAEIASPAEKRRPLPTTPFQVAAALVEETKQKAWDTYLRAYSLAYQFAGYLDERAARGEKAYAFAFWETLYTGDFIDALNSGWRFKDLEDAIDAAQTTKHRFSCCTPRRLLERGESLMKLVYTRRRTGETLRQQLGEEYPSWYLDNVGSHAIEEMRKGIEDEYATQRRSAEDERQRAMELDEDIPPQTLGTTGPIACINPDCPYRFDTTELMHRHFDDCFKQAYDAMPIDEEAVQDEIFADAFDDECGVLPCAIYPWFDEDQVEGRWLGYDEENATGGIFSAWADEDAAREVGTEVRYEG